MCFKLIGGSLRNIKESLVSVISLPQSRNITQFIPLPLITAGLLPGIFKAFNDTPAGNGFVNQHAFLKRKKNKKFLLLSMWLMCSN